MPRNRRRTPKPLSHRGHILAEDVAAAFANLTRRALSLPGCFTYEHIADRLVKMSEQRSTAMPHGHKIILKNEYLRQLESKNFNSPFKNGYKLYEKETSNQVVPISNFGLTQIGRDGIGLVDLLDAPKNVIDKAVSWGGRKSGTAALVVLPSGFQCQLLLRWVELRRNHNKGTTNKTIASFERATTPNNPHIRKLKELAYETNKHSRRALPAPDGDDEE